MDGGDHVYVTHDSGTEYVLTTPWFGGDYNVKVANGLVAVADDHGEMQPDFAESEFYKLFQRTSSLVILAQKYSTRDWQTIIWRVLPQ